jgi:hypothetical protein
MFLLESYPVVDVMIIKIPLKISIPTAKSPVKAVLT